MKILGILLVVIGIASIAWGGFSWTHKKTVLDAGPLEIKTDKHERLPIPPIVGVVFVVAGVALMIPRGR
jgi:uncharacterized membrane protein YidH (DUF202 family)